MATSYTLKKLTDIEDAAPGWIDPAAQAWLAERTDALTIARQMP